MDFLFYVVAACILVQVIFVARWLFRFDGSERGYSPDPETDAKIRAQCEADRVSAADWNRRVAAGEVKNDELPF